MTREGYISIGTAMEMLQWSKPKMARRMKALGIERIKFSDDLRYSYMRRADFERLQAPIVIAQKASDAP